MEVFNAVSKQMDSVGNVGYEVKSVQKADQIAKTADAKVAQDKEEIKQQLNETVKDLNNQMEFLDTNVVFGFNDKIESLYVDVKERSTGRLIRKIPTEETMKLAEHFREIIGLIFDKKG